MPAKTYSASRVAIFALVFCVCFTTMGCLKAYSVFNGDDQPMSGLFHGQQFYNSLSIQGKTIFWILATSTIAPMCYQPFMLSVMGYPLIALDEYGINMLRWNGAKQIKWEDITNMASTESTAWSNGELNIFSTKGVFTLRSFWLSGGDATAKEIVRESLIFAQ